MKPIGGYFPLELANLGTFPHADGILVNSGRNALEFILSSQEVKNFYLPYYTCQVVMEPIEKLGIPYKRYHINEQLEISEEINLSTGEYLLYTNYFGIKDQYCKLLTEKYGKRLILDYAQAFFAEPTDCVGTVFSPRKFVGIPDGGIAYSDRAIEVSEQDQSFDRCSHLLKRHDLGACGGYEDFHLNSVKLHNQPIKHMSELTRALLQSIDFEKAKTQRWQNFKQLHEALGNRNMLQIPDFSSFQCPMVYPYMTDNADLKKHLIANKVFVATYWPNVFHWCKPEDLEYQLAGRCLAIPIDHRYREEEMKFIINQIKI